MPFVLYFRLAVAAHRAFIIFTQGIVLLPFPQLLPEPRPLSAPFLFRTSGKGTDMATPLGPEKYGRIDFSLGRWTTMGQNAPKLELKHAKEQVELVRIFLRSLLRPQESLF